MLAQYESSGELRRLPLAVLGQRRKPGAAERLALAVVSQAVSDISLYHNTRYWWARRAYRDAWRWIFSDDRRNPFSFINLCEALGLSPGKVRAGVNRIIERRQGEAPRRKAA